MKLNPLVIRADASLEIGTGHVMRCLALAQAWQAAGGNAIFCCATLPQVLFDRLIAEGMLVRLLDVVPGSAADANATVTAASGTDADWVVVDGYVFGAEYQQQIKDSGKRLLFIDDNGHAEYYYADIVLNQNIHADASLYTKREPETKLLLGPQYALLRKEFWPWRGYDRQIASVVRNVLVTMGGSDPRRTTLKVIEALNVLDVDATVIVGAGNPDLDQIQSATASHVQVLANVDDMSAQMAWADLAVTSSGSTCWELAMMGLPAIAVIAADNQRQIGTWIGQNGLALMLGDARVTTAEVYKKAIETLQTDFDTRSHMSLVGRALVDGTGVDRVVQVMHAGGQTRFRPIVRNDRALLWLWANDAQTRIHSFDTNPISWDTHCRWFDQQLLRADVRFWMFEDLEVPVGHIRYHVSEGENAAVISFTVGPSNRGRGYGTHLLTHSKQRACAELGVPLVRGTAMIMNIPSCRAFLKAGFTQTGTAMIHGHECAIFEWHNNEAS